MRRIAACQTLFVCALICLILVSIGGSAARADWSAADENLTRYAEKYSEAAENYTKLRYGANNETIQRIKQQLHDLGYFDNRIDQNYGRTLEKASRVFCQQLRIGGGGEEISALMQAMLSDPQNMPYAISPGINIYNYSRYGDQSAYTPYTFAQLSRSNVRTQTQVGFTGRIGAVFNEGSVQYISLRMEDNADYTVYVVYQPLPRTTRFQVGDRVAVFGETQGTQSLAYEQMGSERLLVRADRVGYTK
ncbi:MAG: hypothetical protein LBS72_05635 [Oscillospiraceae bacterium]|jgi:hypothetical protein|nr:hypothetical protein [Oscillospiraceae bacterium]